MWRSRRRIEGRLAKDKSKSSSRMGTLVQDDMTPFWVHLCQAPNAPRYFTFLRLMSAINTTFTMQNPTWCITKTSRNSQFSAGAFCGTPVFASHTWIGPQHHYHDLSVTA